MMMILSNPNGSFPSASLSILEYQTTQKLLGAANGLVIMSLTGEGYDS